MEYSSKKPLVSAPAGFEPVPIPKNPHEDVDSMRVIGPADTDAMRVNPSPNDPTLQAFAHEILHETKLDARPVPTFTYTEKYSESEVKLLNMRLKAILDECSADGTVVDAQVVPVQAVKQQTGFQFKFSPSEEALFKALEESGWCVQLAGQYDGLVGEVGEKGAISQCWNGDPRLNPKRGAAPSEEELLLAIYEVVMERNLKKAMNDAGSGFDTNKYVAEHKTKLDAIWQRIINRNKPGGAS